MWDLPLRSNAAHILGASSPSLVQKGVSHLLPRLDESMGEEGKIARARQTSTRGRDSRWRTVAVRTEHYCHCEAAGYFGWVRLRLATSNILDVNVRAITCLLWNASVAFF